MADEKKLTCPNPKCGGKVSYIGMLSVEGCTNEKCIHYDANAAAKQMELDLSDLDFIFPYTFVHEAPLHPGFTFGKINSEVEFPAADPCVFIPVCVTPEEKE